MSRPIPVTILTGFLGSGKTTLLNRLLKAPALADTAVIVNEFGSVAIDHMLIESASDGIIELADGCLCCTVRGELVDTLADLVDRLQTGRIARLERIVIETTGLADPGPVLHAVMAHPALVQALRLDGVVVTVDACNGGATLDAHQEAVRQVAVADRIVLTKIDLADAAEAADLRRRLERLNPGAALLSNAPHEASAEALFDCGAGAGDLRSWLAHASVPGDHGDRHDHGRDHDGHGHDQRFDSFALVHDQPVPFAAVEAFIDLLRTLHGDRLLRMKGVIELAEDPGRPLVVHGVQKVFHPPARLAAWPRGPRGTRLVLITIDTPAGDIQRLFRALTGAPVIDEPDMAALSANPLAVAGFRTR